MHESRYSYFRSIFLQITSSWQQRKPKQNEREWLGFRREEQHRYMQRNPGISMEKTQLFHNFLIRNQLIGAKNKQPYKAEMNAWRSDWKSAMKSTLLPPLFERFMLDQNNYDLEFWTKAEKYSVDREKENRALRATEIYAVHLSHQAPKRLILLQIDHTTKSQLERTLKNGNEFTNYVTLDSSKIILFKIHSQRFIVIFNTLCTFSECTLVEFFRTRLNVLDATRDEVKSFFSKRCPPRMFKAAKTEVLERVIEQYDRFLESSVFTELLALSL
ncbi:hypothetical protein CAEBREN_02031 [Caenorhabditis brenneri]|uniref:RGS domain-containing protein n=1 Tax=Caenorhabditis brenneri TaxID=135651 RepID=G0P9M1_CAEBE|nr:hypothetical protein CAEBREN_02031 [Caenorhabditis brenneri]